MAHHHESILYLDHNATTPLLPRAWQCMQKVFNAEYGNPSSPHKMGRRAKDLLEESRTRIASLLDAKPHELFFTSGGSEGNNMVLRQLLFHNDPLHLLVSAIEHPSVLETARWLSHRENIELTELEVDTRGYVNPEQLKSNIRPNTCLVSVMAANNETGLIQPLSKLAESCRERGVLFHSDCVQLAGKEELKLSKSGLDYATLTAHKLGGPKGIGLLFIRGGTTFMPLISGGGQERSWRAGTESVALACGFAEALEWFIEQQQSLKKKWRANAHFLLKQLSDMDNFFLLSSSDNSLSNTLNLGFRGLSAESLLISLDLDGIAVSSGSACSSGAMEASHVLLAMGYSHEEAKSSLRISMGWNTSSEEVERFSSRLMHHALRLSKKLKPSNGHTNSKSDLSKIHSD